MTISLSRILSSLNSICRSSETLIKKRSIISAIVGSSQLYFYVSLCAAGREKDVLAEIKAEKSRARKKLEKSFHADRPRGSAMRQRDAKDAGDVKDAGDSRKVSTLVTGISVLNN